MELSRAVDAQGKTQEFLLSPTRDTQGCQTLLLENAGCLSQGHSARDDGGYNLRLPLSFEQAESRGKRVRVL